MTEKFFYAADRLTKVLSVDFFTVFKKLFITKSPHKDTESKQTPSTNKTTELHTFTNSI